MSRSKFEKMLNFYLESKYFDRGLSINKVKKVKKDSLRMYGEFCKLIIALAKKTDLQIIVRPHPTDSENNYSFLKKFKNVKVIKKGNMSTLNCPEEVYLAERLIEINPWSDMVRLARTGGEANAIAIRIARAASGKDNVAICGYHGWHDWYLAANIQSKDGLNEHLLSGLETNGVPKSLEGTVFPFKYNDYEELEKIVDAHDIGVIKMEVIRNKGP